MEVFIPFFYSKPTKCMKYSTPSLSFHLPLCLLPQFDALLARSTCINEVSWLELRVHASAQPIFLPIQIGNTSRYSKRTSQRARSASCHGNTVILKGVSSIKTSSIEEDFQPPKCNYFFPQYSELAFLTNFNCQQTPIQTPKNPISF